MGGTRGTRSTHGVGTLGYASPEQLAGDRGPLTAASDVYSLGATLYAVLTGRSAFPSHAGQTREELLSKVCAGQYAAPRSLNAQVEPALEAICLKAMAVNPADRYRSPAQLATELECHLAGEPVEAWPERWTDRLRRWVARHRSGVLLSTVGLTLSTLFLATLVVQQGRSQRALRAEGERLARSKQRAEQNEQLAVAALQRFGGLVASDPQLRYSRELQPLRRELLKEPIAFLGALRDSLRDVAQPSGATLWQLREATRQLAELQREIGDLGAARQLLDDELELCAQGPGAPAGATRLREADWQIAGAQARLLLAKVLQQLNQPREQLVKARQARAELESLTGQLPHAAELEADLAAAQAAE
ncbi:MAG: serine/threonine-protein kinase, partial [Planctomycetaceae bacterium]